MRWTADIAAGRADGKAAGKAADKAAGRAADQVSGKAADKAAGRADDQAAGKAAAKGYSLTKRRYFDIIYELGIKYFRPCADILMIVHAALCR